jgi:hypothetical protein
MAITLGPDYIEGSGNMDFNRSGNTVFRSTNLGKTGQYPSFTAANTDLNWRYGPELGNSWSAASGWTYAADKWLVNQRGAGSYGFDTSNGRYYAPVSGYYMFGINKYFGNDTNNSSGYTHVNFRKNGNLNFNSGRHGHSIFGYVTTSFYVNGVTMENVIPMNAGDYVEPSPWMTTHSRFYMGHFQFFGHLIN